MNKDALIATLKEAARIAVLGAVGALLAWLSTMTQEIEPTSAQAILLTVLLRLADKYVHKSGDQKGITRF